MCGGDWLQGRAESTAECQWRQYSGYQLPLSTLVRNIPRTSDLLFAVITESLPASGSISSWPAYYPSGQSLTTL